MDKVLGPCLEDVVYKLTNFEDKLQAYQVSSKSNPHQVFYTDKGGYSGQGRGQNNRGGSRGGRNSYSTQGRGFPQQFGQGNTRGSYSDNRPTCQICEKYGHAAFKCYKRFDQNYQTDEAFQALAAMKISDSHGVLR